MKNNKILKKINALIEKKYSGQSLVREEMNILKENKELAEIVENEKLTELVKLRDKGGKLSHTENAYLKNNKAFVEKVLKKLHPRKAAKELKEQVEALLKKGTEVFLSEEEIAFLEENSDGAHIMKMNAIRRAKVHLMIDKMSKERIAMRQDRATSNPENLSEDEKTLFAEENALRNAAEITLEIYGSVIKIPNAAVALEYIKGYQETVSNNIPGVSEVEATVKRLNMNGIIFADGLGNSVVCKTIAEAKAFLNELKNIKQYVGEL